MQIREEYERWRSAQADAFIASRFSGEELSKRLGEVSNQLRKDKTMANMFEHMRADVCRDQLLRILKKELVGELCLPHRCGRDTVRAATGRSAGEFVHEVGYGSAKEIFATHDLAMGILRELLARQEFDWEHRISFQTRSAGTLSASRRTVLVHMLMHSVRHYAQLATLVRQHGINPGWSMDYLFMGAEQA